MIGVSGPALARSCHEAGVLPFLASGHLLEGNTLADELAAVSDLRVGIGFIGHSALERHWDRFVRVLEQHRPPVVQFFAPSVVRRDGVSNIQLAKEYGALTMAQVGSVAEAEEALNENVDALIAQGSEAGGHGLRIELGNATLPLAQALLETSGDTPVLAAGGIVDGRGVAAALSLGCDGVVLGTRLWATTESEGPLAYKERIVQATSPDDTCRTTVFDHLLNQDSSVPWPAPYDSLGTLRNETTRRFDSHVDLTAAMKTDPSVLEGFRQAVRDRNPDVAPVLSGQGAGRIDKIEPATEVLLRIEREYKSILMGK